MSLIARINQVLVEKPDEHIFDDYCVRLVDKVGLRGPNPVLLDLACGPASSPFVNAYASAFPHTKVFSLDIAQPDIRRLKASRKICADARKMPFKNNSFDMIWIGYNVFEYGIVGHDKFTFDESYSVAKEVRRILKCGGAFVFNHLSGEAETETKENLAKIGFKEVTHLLRLSQNILPQGDRHTDAYLVR